MSHHCLQCLLIFIIGSLEQFRNIEDALAYSVQVIQSESNWIKVARRRRNVEILPSCSYPVRHAVLLSHARSLTLTRIRAFAGFNMGTNFAAIEGAVKHEPGSPSEIYLRPPNCLSHASSRLPIGIRALLNEGAVGPTTIATTGRILDLTAYSLDGRTHMSVPKSFADEQPESSSFIDTWHLREARPSTVPGEPSIEEILPMAMLTYSARFSGPLGFANSTSRAARSDCTVKLSLFITHRSEAEEHAIFWIFVVTVESWRTRTEDLHCEGKKLRDLMVERFPWSTDKDLSASVLKRIFFNHELLRSWPDERRFKIE